MDKGAFGSVIPSVAARARTKRMGDVLMNWCGQRRFPTTFYVSGVEELRTVRLVIILLSEMHNHKGSFLCYVPISLTRRDLSCPTVKEEIRRYSSHYGDRLRTHPNHLVVNLLRLPDNRRLRRFLPTDLPDRL
jgi:hypothetical protein